MCQNGLQSASEITKNGRVDYKVGKGLQRVAGLQSMVGYAFLEITMSSCK